MASQKSRPVTIPATEVHRNFSDLVRRVFVGHEHFIIEKDGLPVAAILSMQEYDELMKERQEREKERQERIKKFEKAARAIGEEIERRGLTEEDVEQAVEKAKEKVYKQYYGDTQR